MLRNLNCVNLLYVDSSKILHKHIPFCMHPCRSLPPVFSHSFPPLCV